LGCRSWGVGDLKSQDTSWDWQTRQLSAIAREKHVGPKPILTDGKYADQSVA
jgi:hypothetical protein